MLVKTARKFQLLSNLVHFYNSKIEIFKFNKNFKQFIEPKGKLDVIAHFSQDSLRVIVEADGCGQAGSPITVFITRVLLKPLTEDIQL